jgi:hypothetical protein
MRGQLRDVVEVGRFVVARLLVGGEAAIVALDPHHPGSAHPGSHHPGSDHPGSHHPGSHHPGSHHPGSHHPGSHHPGSDRPQSGMAATADLSRRPLVRR